MDAFSATWFISHSYNYFELKRRKEELVRYSKANRFAVSWRLKMPTKVTNTSVHIADLNDGNSSLDFAVTNYSVEIFFSLLLRILRCCLFKCVIDDETAVVSCVGLILRGWGGQNRQWVLGFKSRSHCIMRGSNWFEPALKCTYRLFPHSVFLFAPSSTQSVERIFLSPPPVLRMV
jgi:hypothetical protein